ncbi:hypothetical protein B0H19DRAFT_424070 [Mycena capillaripes]|nr:hypothetical protein B0H19DRAFT_424070 [Mycena capillaripes]
MASRSPLSRPRCTYPLLCRFRNTPSCMGYRISSVPAPAMRTAVCTHFCFLLGQCPSNCVDDWYTVFTHWVSNVWAAVMTWFKKVFEVVMKWTHETIPVVTAWLTDAMTSASQPIKEHPHATLIISASIFLGPQILLLPLLILQGIFFLLLSMIGFGASGIVGGSPAARYQSLCYGGNTPASSLFAIFQSIGMKYHIVTLSNWVLAMIRLLAGLVFVYVMILLW